MTRPAILGRSGAAFPRPAPVGDGDGDGGTVLAGRLSSYIADHRKRLRTRFTQRGAHALPDHEMLELILFRANPRQDVKPRAR